MVKVLMLTTSTSLLDGVNRHILTVASALNGREDVVVAVCTVMPWGDLNNALQKNGVRSFALGFPHGHSVSILKAYSKVVKQFNPDVVHIHVMAITEKIVSAIKFRNIKYVTTIHGISDAKSNVSFKERLEMVLNSIFSLPISAYCYISDGVMQKLDDNNKSSKAVRAVVYNPIYFDCPLKYSAKLHELIRISSDTPIIGTSCRIAAVKNPALFTETMCKVLQANQSCHAVVMGDGVEELKEQCRRVVAEYKVEDRFHWLGYRTDAPHLVNDLSCFVMTSVSEGMPTSILECMAVKTPFAILEGNGGLVDLAKMNSEEGPFAVVAPKGDVETLANGIIHLLQNPELAHEYAERAYQVGKRYFDVDAVAGQLVGIYQKVLNK